MPALLFAVSCSEAGGSEDTDASTSPTVDCSEIDSEVLGVDVEQAPASTVSTVRWNMDGPARTWVSFAVVGEDARTTPPKDVDSGSTRALLLGLPGNAEVEYQVVLEQRDETLCTAVEVLTTGGLPAELPEFRIDQRLPEETDHGFLIAPVFRDNGYFAAVIDTLGRYVWAMPVPSGARRLRHALAGQHLIVNEQAVSPTATGALMRLGLDGQPLGVTDAVGMHTDFVEVEPDVFVVLTWDRREVAGHGLPVVGDAVVEIDGTGVREIWNAWDALDIDLYDDLPTASLVMDEPVEDWTHGNGLSYDAASDSLLVSLSGADSVVKVDRATGQTKWILGGIESDFEIASDAIRGVHSAQQLEDDRVLVFNRNQLGVDCAEAVEITLDQSAWTAEQTWSYASDDCLPVYFLGQAERLPSGNTLTVFTTSGVIDQATADGRTAWRLTFDLGAAPGFSELVETLY